MRSIRITVSCLLIVLGLSVTAAPASADEPNPVNKVLTKVKELVTPKNKVSTTVVAPSPSTDDDSPGHETTDPVAPDHASTRGLNAGILGTGVAGLNENTATVNDDDSTTADSTLLSLGGQTVIGTHAESTGDNEDFFSPLAPLCVVSGSMVCVEALYSYSTATDDGTTSEATAESGLVNACLFGTDTDISNGCDGPISIGAALSDAGIVRDQPSGQTQASAYSAAADTCVGIFEICLRAIDSYGAADSGGPAPGADRYSNVLFLGDDEEFLSEPFDFSFLPGCPSLTVFCMFLNQGETYLAPGIAGTAQDALLLSLLQLINIPGGEGLQLGVPVALIGIGHTETLVHNDGGEVIDPCLEDPQSCEPNPCDEFSDEDCNGCDEHCDHDDDDDGDGRDKHHHHHALPDTGGPSSGLLAIGLFGVAIGSAFVAAGRRERKVA